MAERKPLQDLWASNVDGRYREQRARLAAEQVLPQKGIANTTCPLTGEPLTANASAVAFEGTVVGFATPADAAQFRSLKPEKQSKLIADWKTESSAS